MKAVLKYSGAKNRIASWICEYIPTHRNYVEPFLGSGAVFFNKEPSYLEILNDIDDDIVNFFRVLRENEEKLIKRLILRHMQEVNIRLRMKSAKKEMK